MIMPAILAAPPVQPPTLEATARRFAAMDRDEAETMIDAQATSAIREWRIADATYWQRVKFRSRMLRTATARRTHLVKEA